MKSSLSIILWIFVCNATGKHQNKTVNAKEDLAEADNSTRLSRQRRGPIRAAIGAALGVGAGILGYKLIRNKFRHSSEEYHHHHHHGFNQRYNQPVAPIPVAANPCPPVQAQVRTNLVAACVQPAQIIHHQPVVHRPVVQSPPPAPPAPPPQRIIHEHIHEHHHPAPQYRLPIEAGLNVKAHIIGSCEQCAPPAPPPPLPPPPQQPIQPVKHIIENLEIHVKKPVIKPAIVVDHKCEDKHKECHTYVRQCTRKSIVTVCPKTCGICA
ncbi:hypothetical protein ACOME3_000637 [Neoechinorhynchus agilis]